MYLVLCYVMCYADNILLKFPTPYKIIEQVWSLQSLLFYPENGSNMFLRNIDIYLPDSTVSAHKTELLD
jgi:hypothetical protein